MGLISTADVAAEVRGEKTPEDKVEALADDRLQEVYTFQFAFTSRRGKKFEGSFTNHILSGMDKIQVGVMCARLSQGQPFEALPVETQILLRRLAHLEYSLARGKELRPKWADDLGQIKDDELIEALYQEVLDHERIFRGYDVDSEAGATTGANDGG